MTKGFLAMGADGFSVMGRPVIWQKGRKIFRPYGHRRTIRLRGCDYSLAGAYFVTVCTRNRESLFGDIINGTMRLNDTGRTVQQCWDEIPRHFPQVALDTYVVMLNHVHGIVVIAGDVSVGDAGAVGAKNFSPSPPAHPPPHPKGTSKTIGSIVRGFKIGVTKRMHRNTAVHDVWQRNYWEHVVRNEPELNRIREYINCNPQRWELDRLCVGGSETISVPRVFEPVSRYGIEEWMA